MRGRGIIWGILAVIGLITSYFTVSSKDAVKWNDKVVAIYQRFGAAWAPLQPIVGSWVEGKPIEAARLDSALEKYAKDIGQTAAELRRETPPDDELCKSMHAEMVRFADLEESQIAELRTLAGAMKASNPGSPAELKRVAEALDGLGKKETAQDAAVNARQKAMASKFKIKLR